MKQKNEPSFDESVLNIKSVLYFIVIAIIALIFFIFQIFNTSGSIIPLPKFQAFEVDSIQSKVPSKFSKSSENYWIAPDITSLKGSALESQILYGKELIQNTSKYLGPKGSVAQISNGMNCQNCHLDAGTK
ncbi:MAG: cytochrome C, partial [Saprospiraceae bacterium]|nr:cytochrome C [Saprospiraceae bacterium]